MQPQASKSLASKSKLFWKLLRKLIILHQGNRWKQLEDLRNVNNVAGSYQASQQSSWKLFGRFVMLHEHSICKFLGKDALLHPENSWKLLDNMLLNNVVQGFKPYEQRSWKLFEGQSRLVILVKNKRKLIGIFQSLYWRLGRLLGKLVMQIEVARKVSHTTSRKQLEVVRHVSSLAQNCKIHARCD